MSVASTSMLYIRINQEQLKSGKFDVEINLILTTSSWVWYSHATFTTTSLSIFLNQFFFILYS